MQEGGLGVCHANLGGKGAGSFPGWRRGLVAVALGNRGGGAGARPPGLREDGGSSGQSGRSQTVGGVGAWGLLPSSGSIPIRGFLELPAKEKTKPQSSTQRGHVSLSSHPSTSHLSACLSTYHPATRLSSLHTSQCSTRLQGAGQRSSAETRGKPLTRIWRSFLVTRAMQQEESPQRGHFSRVLTTRQDSAGWGSHPFAP